MRRPRIDDLAAFLLADNVEEMPFSAALRSLLPMHGCDNSPFLDQLEEMGFYIARGSLNNY